MKRLIATLSLVVISTAAVSVAAPREAHAGKTGTAVAAGIAAGLFSNLLFSTLGNPNEPTVIHETVVQPQTVYVQPAPVVIKRTTRVVRIKCTNVFDAWGNLISRQCY